MRFFHSIFPKVIKLYTKQIYSYCKLISYKGLNTTHVMCVNFIHQWRYLKFDVDYEGQLLRNFFMAGLFTLKVFIRNLLRVNHRRNIFFHTTAISHFYRMVNHCTMVILSGHYPFGMHGERLNILTYELGRS